MSAPTTLGQPSVLVSPGGTVPSSSSRPSTPQQTQMVLPQMVFLVEDMILPVDEQVQTDAALPVRESQPTEHISAVVLLDGREVPGGRITRIPSGPVSIKPNRCDEEIQIILFKTTAVDGLLDGACSLQQLRDTHPIAAVFSISAERLLQYGLPLYTSFWLGLFEDTRTQFFEDFDSAAHGLKDSNTIKLQLTIFKPILGEASQLRPDVHSSTDVNTSGENHSHRGSQVEGVINCLQESNNILGVMLRSLACKSGVPDDAREQKESWRKKWAVDMIRHAIISAKNRHVIDLLYAKLEKCNMERHQLLEMFERKEVAWANEMDGIVCQHRDSTVAALESLKTQHANEVSTLRHSQNVELLRLKQQHLDEISTLREDYNRSIKMMDDVSKDAVVHQQHSHENEAAASELQLAEHSNEVANLKEELRLTREANRKLASELTQVDELKQELECARRMYKERESLEADVSSFQISYGSECNTPCDNHMVGFAHEVQLRRLVEENCKDRIRSMEEHMSDIETKCEREARNLERKCQLEVGEETAVLRERLKNAEVNREAQERSHRVEMRHVRLECETTSLRDRLEHGSGMKSKDERAECELALLRDLMEQAETRYLKEYTEQASEIQHRLLPREHVRNEKQKQVLHSMLEDDTSSEWQQSVEANLKQDNELAMLVQKLALLGSTVYDLKCQADVVHESRYPPSTTTSDKCENKIGLQTRTSEFKNGAELNEENTLPTAAITMTQDHSVTPRFITVGGSPIMPSPVLSVPPFIHHCKVDRNIRHSSPPVRGMASPRATSPRPTVVRSTTAPLVYQHQAGPNRTTKGRPVSVVAHQHQTGSYTADRQTSGGSVCLVAYQDQTGSPKVDRQPTGGSVSLASQAYFRGRGTSAQAASVPVPSFLSSIEVGQPLSARHTRIVRPPAPLSARS